MMRVNQEDMSESTQDKIMSGITQKGVTAYATSKAEQNAKIFLGVFSTMIADLVKQIGELVIDDILLHTTVGEIDATVPESLRMKYKTIMLQGKDSGKDVTNRIEFSTDMMDDKFDKEKANELEWEMFEEAGGMESKQRNYKVNPYKFARTQFNLFVDPEMITSRSMGTDQLKKERAFNILTDPRVAPFVNQQAVVDKYVLEEFSDGDPDEFKRKEGQNDILNAVMGQVPGAPPAQPGSQLSVPNPY